MIEKEQIALLIKDKLIENNCFLVDIDVCDGSVISIEIDSYDGVSVTDCVEISKVLDDNLDREVQDFEMNVSSAGLDKPLRVIDQYKKNIGRDVKVVPNNGLVVKGELVSVNNESVVVEYSYKEKIEGRKKKNTIVKRDIIKFNNIKETTVVISFK